MEVQINTFLINIFHPPRNWLFWSCVFTCLFVCRITQKLPDGFYQTWEEDGELVTEDRIQFWWGSWNLIIRVLVGLGGGSMYMTWPDYWLQGPLDGALRLTSGPQPSGLEDFRWRIKWFIFGKMQDDPLHRLMLCISYLHFQQLFIFTWWISIYSSGLEAVVTVIRNQWQ